MIPRNLEPPLRLRQDYAAWAWSVAWSYEGAITTWRLDSVHDQVRFLKVRAVDETPSLGDEAVRLRWARGYLPVPEVVAHGTEGGIDWLLLEELAGLDGTATPLKTDPERLVPILARGLRRFHEAPVTACPFRLTVGDAIATVRQRVDSGRAERQDLHPEFSHLTLDEALATLDELAPAEEDLVVCHGDYCFPNVILVGDEISGYIDLGELAVADRWWDVAVGSWSTTWNIGPGWEQLFLDSYGIVADHRRMTFYRLLYDLIS